MQGKKWLPLIAWVWILLALAGTAPEAAMTNAAAAIPEEGCFVALTFDDGPRVGTTDRLLDGLLTRGASATFFLVGEEAEKAPELVRRMKQEGHQVGNHTWSHVRLEDAPLEEARQEVEKTDALLTELLGSGKYWLRPPYGQITQELEATLQTPVITWSVDPRDWESRNTEKVVAAVLRDARLGCIILLHDIYPTSVDAALKIVDTLQGQGMSFVTVEDLLRLRGIEPQAGALYRSGE